MRFRFRTLLIVITLLACGIAFLRSAYIELTHVETGENIDSVSWLPKSASHISYLRSYGFTAYEFDISESDFRAWSSWELQPISKPVTVMRYSFTNQADFDTRNTSMAQWDRWEEKCRATVSDGLWYERRRGNGGGVTVAYDRTKGRAYIQTSPR
jgi:hypothetical protein